MVSRMSGRTWDRTAIQLTPAWPLTHRVSAAPSSAGKAGPPLPAFTFRKRPGLDHRSLLAARLDLLLPLH